MSRNYKFHNPEGLYFVRLQMKTTRKIRTGAWGEPGA